MPILHLQSSIAAFFLHRVFGYRKKVIRDNLRQAFPEHSENELRKIESGFYRHFADVLVEILKQLSISSKNLKRRVRCINPEVIPEMVAHGGGGIAVFAHYCNWEWLGAGMGLQLPFSTVGVYHTLRNKTMNALVYHIRTRLGNEMITMEQTYRESLKRLKAPCYIAFLGDQNPTPNPNLYFTSFLGRRAAIHLGIATISRKLDVPLYYFDVKRVKRGFYEVELVRISSEGLPDGKQGVYELTERHLEYLEEVIRREPAWWLWSHRRWRRKVGSGAVFSRKLQGEEGQEN